MKNPAHIREIKKGFDLGVVKPHLRQEDAKLIEKYGSWYLALIKERISCETEAQKSFLEAARGKKTPSGEHEVAWANYMHILKTVKISTIPTHPEIPFGFDAYGNNWDYTAIK